jgi:hypothetical protein
MNVVDSSELYDPLTGTFSGVLAIPVLKETINGVCILFGKECSYSKDPMCPPCMVERVIAD